MHILDDFKNEVADNVDPRVNGELKAVKDCNKKFEERFLEMKNQISDPN